MAAGAVSKSGGNYIVTITIPEADIAVEGRDNIRKEITAEVGKCCQCAHMGIQLSNVALDADENMGRKQVAAVKAGRWTFTGI